MFPKYILDYEDRMRKEHNQVAQTTKFAGGLNESQAYGKKKRNSATSVMN